MTAAITEALRATPKLCELLAKDRRKLGVLAGLLLGRKLETDAILATLAAAGIPDDHAIEEGELAVKEGRATIEMWFRVAGPGEEWGAPVARALARTTTPSKPPDDNARLLAGDLPADPGEGLEPFQPPPALPAREIEQPRHAAEVDRFRVIGTDAIFEPLPPPAWLVPDLLLGPGRPSMIAGFSYSGKSLAAQSLALSVASGARAWGHFRVPEAAVVLYVDFEQGPKATRRRFHSLARAMGITVAALGGRLRLASLPLFKLTDASAEVDLAQRCVDVGLCVIDTFRAATPGEEENDSRISAFLEVLTRVSDQTGTTFLVVHHAGKKKDPRGTPDPRELARGSSAIFSAAGTVFVMVKEGNLPTEVHFAKLSAEADSAPPEPFYLAFDTPAGGGLRLVFKTREQVKPPRSADDEARADVERVADAVAKEPGLGVRELKSRLARMGAVRQGAAIDAAERLGRITITRDKKHRHFPAGDSQAGDKP